MRWLASGFLVFAGLALIACAGDYLDEPLSQPGTFRCDPRVLGDWYGEEPQRPNTYDLMQVASDSNDTLIVSLVTYARPDEYGQYEPGVVMKVIAYPTVIAGNIYYNVSPLSVDDTSLLGESPGYVIVWVTFDGDDVLRLHNLDRDKLEALEKSGDLRLRRHCERCWEYTCCDFHVENAGPEVAALIQRVGPQSLFSDDALVLSRQRPTSAVRPQ
jgi:hypothetical protein